MTQQHHVHGDRLAGALATCPTLAERTSERDALWLVVQSTVCTQSAADVVPLGSSSPVRVTSEYATDELIAAMEWLMTHEKAARELAPLRLFVLLRAAATRSATGSARAAQADSLRGLTNVVPGNPVRWSHVDPIDEAS